jgi:hypothetical protein
MLDLERFQGGSPRTPEEEEFLRGLASGIDGWTVEDVQPESFMVLDVLVPLVVTLDVPGIELRSGSCTLQVGYWHDGPDGRVLEGEWGNELILDSHVYDADGLTVIGLTEAPATYGTLAARWLERQLLRPVERLDWFRGDEIRTSSWRLADSGRTIAGSGGWRLPGLPPSRRTKIR